MKEESYYSQVEWRLCLGCFVTLSFIAVFTEALRVPLMNANETYGVLSKTDPLALQGFGRD